MLVISYCVVCSVYTNIHRASDVHTYAIAKWCECVFVCRADNVFNFYWRCKARQGTANGIANTNIHSQHTTWAKRSKECERRRRRKKFLKYLHRLEFAIWNATNSFGTSYDLLSRCVCMRACLLVYMFAYIMCVCARVFCCINSKWKFHSRKWYRRDRE